MQALSETVTAVSIYRQVEGKRSHAVRTRRRELRHVPDEHFGSSNIPSCLVRGNTFNSSNEKSLPEIDMNQLLQALSLSRHICDFALLGIIFALNAPKLSCPAYFLNSMQAQFTASTLRLRRNPSRLPMSTSADSDNLQLFNSMYV